jgi:deoxyribonuclease-4
LIAVKIGFHLSIAGGLDKAVDRALLLGCETFQIFTLNPRQWRARELTVDAAQAFVEKVKRSGLTPVFSHMPYLPNLASPRDEVYAKSVAALTLELERGRRLAIPYLVTHLGSHLGAGVPAGTRRIVDAIDHALDAAGGRVMLLLENSAGTRQSMGGSFAGIADLIRRVADPERVGVCLDTCHAFAAGYDLRTRAAVEGTLRTIDATVGFEKLKLVHLNDSRGDLGSHIDRHAHIGLGKIGETGFRHLLRSRLGRLPLILETPQDDSRRDIDNLRKVRELAGDLFG